MEGPWHGRWHAIASAILLVSLALSLPSVDAVSYSLVGKVTSSSQVNLLWSNAKIWSPAGVPGLNDTVTIRNTNSLSGCRLQIMQNVTISSLTMVDTNSRTCVVQVMPGVGLTVTNSLSHGAYRFIVEGAVQATDFTFSGYYLQGPQQQSGTIGQITITRTLLIRRGSFSTKYLQYIRLVNSGTGSFSSDMYTRSFYCTACAIVNTGVLQTVEARFYVSGTTSADADGFKQGFINMGTLAFPLRSTTMYCYWDVKNYGTINLVTVRWGSTYQLYISSTTSVWINRGVLNIYMANLYARSFANFIGTGGKVNMYGRPGLWKSSPKTPQGASSYTSWKTYLSDVYGELDNGTYFWNTNYLSNLQFYFRNPITNFDLGQINSFGRTRVYLYFYSSTQPQRAQISGGMNLSPDTMFYSTCSISTTSSSTLQKPEIDIFGAIPTIGSLQIQAGCIVRMQSSSQIRVARQVTVNQLATLQLNSVSIKNFYDNVYVSTGSQLFLGGGSANFYSQLLVDATLTANGSYVTTFSSFIWQSGTLSGVNQGQLTTSGPAYVMKNSAAKHIQGLVLNINRVSQPATGQVIAEYFQYRVATNRTQRLSSIQYWPGQSTSSYTLPSNFDSSSTIPTLVRLESRIQRPASYYGNGPLQWTSNTYASVASGSDLTFNYNFAARIWFFLQIDVAGQYSFYVNNGYSIAARLWIDGQVQSPTFSPYRVSSSQPSATDNAPIAANLTVGTVRIRMDYFVRSSSNYNSFGQMLLLSYSGPSVAKQYIPLNKVSWKRTVNGRTEFANPDAASNVSSTISQMDVLHDSLFFLTQASSISISSSGLMNVLADTSIIGDSDSSGARSSQLTNAGELRKSVTTGIATFYLSYVNRGGRLTFLEGRIDFPQSGKAVLIWNNTNGGSWQDASNWIPRRVPGANDIVLLTAPGSYSVVITGNNKIDSLFVGDGGASNPLLVLSHYATLTVTDRLDVHATKLSVYGVLDAANVIWSGQYITGTGVGSVLVARTTFAMISGSGSNKYFQDVVVQNFGQFTIDAALENRYFYCSGCKIINSQSGTMLFPAVRFYWQQGSCPSSILTTTGPVNQPCAQSGLVNSGVITVEIYRYSPYWYYMPIFSNGTIRAVTIRWRSTYTWYIYYPYIAGGTLQSYSTYIRMQYRRTSRFKIQVDKFQMYGAKYWTGSTPPGANIRGGSTAFINALYGNTSVPYDFYGSPGLYLVGIYGSSSANLLDITFGELTSFGRTSITASGLYNVRLTFSRLINLSPLTTISLPTASQWAVVTLAPTTILGYTDIGSNWFLEGPSTGTFSCNSLLYIRPNGTLAINGGSVALRNVFLASGGYLTTATSTVSVSGFMQTYGTVDFGSGATSIPGSWWYMQGSLSAGSLTTMGRWVVGGNSNKVINKLSATIQQPPQLVTPLTERQGVFAEYFQMRVSNPQNPTPTGTPTSFPPFPGFDNATTRPVFWRFESDVNHPRAYNGWAPQQYLTTTASANTSSIYTFQYNFAVRYWTWLKLPRTGTYTFTLRSDYGLRPRLWIDGSIVLTGNFNQYFDRVTTNPSRVSQTLTSGYHRVRLDLLQKSSSWSTYNAMYIFMSGPGIQDAPIPTGMQYVSAAPSGGLVTFATPGFNAGFAQNNFAAVFSGGEIVSWSASSVTIGSGALLDVQSDVSFLCFSTAQCILNNYGTLRRSGGFGPSQFYLQYDNKSVGVLDQQVSSLSFLHSSSAAGRIRWIGTSSGYWNNASNWFPRRVPMPDDIVNINALAALTILIPDGVAANVSTLLLGNGGTGPSLEISHLASLTVTGRIELASGNVVINGFIDANTVVWSGQTITASQTLIGKHSLIVRKSMTITGSSTRRYLKYVSIVNYGILTQDSAQNNAYTYCQGCTVRTMAGASTILSSRYFSLSGSNTADPTTGYRVGFENYGSLVFRPASSSLYCYWDIKNFGRVAVLPFYYLTRVNVYLYNVWINYANVHFYVASVYSYGNRGFASPKVTTTAAGKTWTTNNGVWSLHSYPLVYNSGSIKGNRSPTLWKEWLEGTFASGLYTGSTAYWYMYYTNRNTYFGTLNLKGRIQWQCQYSYNYNVSVGYLNMDPASLLYLNRVQGSARPYVVLERAAKPHNIGFVFSYYFYGLMVKGDAVFASGVSLSTYGRLFVQPQTEVSFLQHAVLSSSSQFTISNGKATFYDILRLYTGTFSIPGSTVTVLNAMQWTSTSINGVGGKIVVSRDSQLAGSSRQLQDVSLIVDGMQVDGTRRGFIAEYFQYQRTARGRNLFYSESTSSSALPQSFEDPRTAPAMYRFETFVQRTPQPYGASPKYINTGSSSFSTSYQLTSFPYYYAARLSAFLNVPTSGSYTFYFKTGYSLRARLWMDGVIRFTSPTGYRSPSAADESSSAIPLSAGYHLLRIDYLVSSSSYSSTTGSMLLISWSGPNIPKTYLPVSSLRPFLFNSSTSSFQAASQSAQYSSPLPGICNSTFSVSQALSRPFSYSRFYSQGGLRTNQNGRIVVGNRGILDLATSTSWTYSPSRIQLFVNGLVTRSAGSGLLNLNTLYNISASGCQKATSGSLELGVNSLGATAPTVSGTGTVPVPSVGTAMPPSYPPGVTVTWNGTGSGAWDDRRNWDMRVPLPNDNVIIPTRTTGTTRFTVTLSDNVVVASLTVGSATSTSTSYSSFRVQPGASLIVTGTLQLNSYYNYFYGSVTVSRFEWQGYRLYGSNTGKLTITSSGTILRGLYSSKYLQQIQIVNNGAYVTDSTMSSGNLYCDRCLITNAAGATFVNNGMDLRVSSTNYPSNTLSTAFGNGQPHHFNNMGNFSMVLDSSNRYAYIYMVFSNSGTMRFVSNGYRQTSYIYLYALPVKTGRVISYFTRMYWYGNYNYGASASTALSSADLEVYSYPLLQPNAPTPATRSNIADYQQFITDVFSGAVPKLWDMSLQTSIYFYNFYSQRITGASITTHGYVTAYFSNNYGCVFSSILVQQDYAGYISLAGTTGSANTISFNTSSYTGSLYQDSGWLVTAPSSFVSNFVYMRGSVNCALTLSNNTRSANVRQIFVGSACALTVQTTSLTTGILDVFGFVNLASGSSVTANDIFRWSAGKITGSGTRNQIVAPGYVNITGFGLKTHDGVDIVFSQKTIPTSTQGVVAQYFHYRETSNTTSPPSYIYYFHSTDGTLATGHLPASFDDVSTPADLQRVEPTIQRMPGYYRNRVDFFQSNGNQDLTPALSFSRLFAVRMLAYIKIDTAGDYTFYLRFRTGPARLWIDGKVVLTGARGSSINTEIPSNATTLTAGNHLLRVDVVLSTDSSVAYGANVLVSYSATGVPKQLIPESKLRVYNDQTSAPASSVIVNNVLPQRSLVNSEAIIARNGASVSVAAGRQVYLAGDVLWLSTLSTTKSSTMHLQGSLVKLGAGIATFYMAYAASGIGGLVQTDGKIRFTTPTAANVPIFWNSTSGGMWNDAANWYPSRVPTAGSIVFIDLPGAYTVIIPPKVSATVENLIVGGTTSSPQLYISAQASLVVNNRLDLLTPRFTIQGLVDAGRVTLGGQYITGSTGSFSTNSKLIIRKSLAFLESSSNIYLQNIEVTNYGTAVLGSSTRNINIYCQACTVINNGVLTISRGYLRVTGTTPSYDSNNFRLGIRNMASGLLHLDITNSYRYQYIYWDIMNAGQLTLLGRGLYSSNYRAYFYGTLTNIGTVTVYSCSMYLYAGSNNRMLQYGTGNVMLYGAPAYNVTAGPLPVTLQPAAYIAAVFGVVSNTKPAVYNPYSAALLYISGLYQTSVQFGTVFAYGYTTIQLSYCRYTNISVTKSFDVGSMNQLLLQGTSSGSSVFTATGVARLGQLYNSGYWTVSLTTGASVFPVYDLLTLAGNASVSFTSSASSSIVFRRDLSVPSGTSLSFTGGKVQFNRRVIAIGDIRFANSGGLVRGSLLWGGGMLSGLSPSQSYLTLAGGCSLKGVAHRTLDALNLGIQNVARTGNNGVIAEYFSFSGDGGTVTNYWQSNSTQCTDQNRCVPASFDSSSTGANSIRLESSLGIVQVQNNPGPVTFTSTGSLGSSQFSYNYAVRRTAYLQVQNSGMYRFSVVGFYRVSRVWVNGAIIYTSSSYSSTGYPAQTTPFVQLIAGASNHIRIDIIVTSSSRKGLGVYYEGPGVPLQLISDSSLFYSNPTTGVFATSQWKQPVRSLCNFSDDAVTTMSNAAVLNVTRTGAVDVQDDVLWYSSSSAGSTGQVINNGRITKSGGTGIAVFLAQISGNGLVGPQIQILSGSAGRGVVFWNNPNGGVWSEPRNWMPQRVPTATDYVFITTPGTYKVVVDGTAGQSCVQLDVGASDAAVTFVINYYSSLRVSKKLFLNSKSTLLHGPLTAGSISWSGSTITGMSHTNQPVSVSATGGFTASTRAYTTRTLTNIGLSMGGSSIWDSSINRLVLTNSNITVLAGGVLNLPVYYFGSTYVRTRMTSFLSGIINYGTVLFASTSSRLYMYQDLQNYGTVYIGRSCVTSTLTPYLYGYLGNMASGSLIRFYNANVYFYQYVILPTNAQGTIEFYGQPSASSSIPGNCDSTQFMTTINSLYNVTRYSSLYAGSGIVWNIASTRYVYVYEQNYGSANFSTLRTRGRVEVRLYTRSRSNISISTSLDMDGQGSLYLYTGRVSGSSGRLLLPKSVMLGSWYWQTGWVVVIPSNARMSISKDFIMRSGTSLSFIGGSLTCQSSLVLDTTATLTATDAMISVSGNVFHNGKMNLVSSIVDFGHDMNWPQGSIQGRDTWIYIRRRMTSSSSSPLVLTGANMRLVLEGEVARPSASRGVLAEYFQYRIGPNRKSSLFGFFNDSSRDQYNVPQSFDNAMTEPTYSRIEPSVSYAGEYIGHYPLFYSRSSVDGNNMYTFTYNFAVRYTFYAYIPVTSSDYRIHFSGPMYTTKYVRVWVNDTAPSATISAGYYPRSSFVSGISFGRGYNKIRVDVVQSSSYYNTIGNMLFVAYELPGILPKTLLDNTNTYYRQSPYWTGTGSPYPAPSFQVLSTPVCKFESANATYDLCNNVDAGAACWKMGGRSFISSSDGPSIWLTKSGVLDVTSSADWTWTNSRLSLLNSGLVARTSSSSPISLNAQLATSGGCNRWNAGTLNIGISGGAATFPPTTEPPPTLPPPTTMPPVQERGPSSWSSDDVQEWIATMGSGEFAKLGKYFAGYSGAQLVALTREEFLKLVPPENAELAAQLYDSFIKQRDTYEPQTNSSSATTGIAVGAAVGVVVLIAVALLVVVVLKRQAGGDSATFLGRRSVRMSDLPDETLNVQNPGFANQSYDKATPRQATGFVNQSYDKATPGQAASDKAKLAQEDALYDDVHADEENLYEDVGAHPGTYANTTHQGMSDVYEVMG